jgi:hypothetical protein
VLFTAAFGSDGVCCPWRCWGALSRDAALLFLLADASMETLCRPGPGVLWERTPKTAPLFRRRAGFAWALSWRL